MSIFHIKCECGNKYIKSNNIFLKWFGEGILSFNLAVVVTFFSSIYINGILNIFIVFFIFLILFIFLEILIANIGYKKYLEKE